MKNANDIAELKQIRKSLTSEIHDKETVYKVRTFTKAENMDYKTQFVSRTSDPNYVVNIRNNELIYVLISIKSVNNYDQEDRRIIERYVIGDDLNEENKVPIKAWEIEAEQEGFEQDRQHDVYLLQKFDKTGNAQSALVIETDFPRVLFDLVSNEPIALLNKLENIKHYLYYSGDQIEHCTIESELNEGNRVPSDMVEIEYQKKLREQQKTYEKLQKKAYSLR